MFQKTPYILALSIGLLTCTHAMGMPKGELSLSLGGAHMHQGQSQFVGIQNTFGNNHVISDKHDDVFVGGLGYLFEALVTKAWIYH